MSYKKNELVYAALEEFGIAEYEFDITPEQVESGLRRLDAMLAEWSGRGVILYFPIDTPGNSEPSQDSGVPDWAWQAVITNLAVKLAPSYGKTVSPDTKLTAKNSLNSLYQKFSSPNEMQFPSMPRGAGYKNLNTYRWTPVPEDKYLKPVDDEVDLSGGPEDG